MQLVDPDIEEEEEELKCNMFEGLPYKVKLYLGPPDFPKHYQMKKQVYLTGCKIKARGHDACLKVAITMVEVGLRKDGKLEFKGSVYEDIVNIFNLERCLKSKQREIQPLQSPSSFTSVMPGQTVIIKIRMICKGMSRET